MCIKIDDPSWPSVHPSSYEFVAQRTRFQWSILCDAYDQEEAHPDADSYCEDDTSSDPSADVSKCTRLGGKKNPCKLESIQFSLWVCDDDICEVLTATELESQFKYEQGGVTYFNETGAEWKFEHDAAPSKNKFQCKTHAFNNTALKAADCAGWHPEC